MEFFLKSMRSVFKPVFFIAFFATSLAHTCIELPNLEKALLNSNLDPKDLLLHGFNRLGYGPTGQSKAFENLKAHKTKEAKISFVASFIKNQLQTLNDLPFKERFEDEFPGVYSQSLSEIQSYFVKLDPVEQREERQKARRGYRRGLRLRKMYSAIKYNGLNFSEVLNDFWFNHLNVNARGNPFFALDYERQLASKKCSTVYEIILTSAQHPMMLEYLDNARNTKLIKKKDGSVKSDINENYGREIIELHTLGVAPVLGFQDNGKPILAYTQKEIYEASRVLTGWGYQKASKKNKDQATQFKFFGARHDRGIKEFDTLFSYRDEVQVKFNAGFEEGKRFIGALVSHPLTKRNICKKLLFHISGTKIENESIIANCIDAYGKRGNLPKIYQAIIESDSFWLQDQFQSGFKTPFEYIVSATRAWGIPNLPRKMEDLKFITNLINKVKTMGMDYYEVAPPTGYDYGIQAWASTSYLNQVAKFPGIYTGSLPLQRKVNSEKSSELQMRRILKNQGVSKFFQVLLDELFLIGNSNFRESKIFTMTRKKIEDKRFDHYIKPERNIILPVRTAITNITSSSYFIKK